MRVLAAAVVAPHMAVSGAVTAATEHSRALTPYCSIELAYMAPEDAVERVDGLVIHKVRSWLPFGTMLDGASNKVRTPLYRSGIPDLVRRGGYDLIHLHNPMPGLEMERIAQAARAAGIPYVVSAHGFVELGSGGRAYGLSPLGRVAWYVLAERPVRAVVRRAAAVLATSPVDGAVALGFGCPEDRLHTVPNGVTLPQKGRATPQEAAELAARLGFAGELAQGLPIVFFLANHTPNKGLPVLLDAAARSTVPHLLVVGGSPRSSIDYDRYRMGAGAARILFTGLLSPEDKELMFRTADLFVFPSLADTFPMVVLEAMAHGLPVLATRVGGIPYQVEHENTGRLVPPGDPAALAGALDRLLASPSTMKTMGEAAVARVRNRLTWERAAVETISIYRRVLAERSNKAAMAGPRVAPTG